MSNYNFEIGTELYNMQNLEDDLGVFPPKQEGFVPARVDVEAADARTYQHGWGETTLKWGYITTAMRTALRVYIPSRSARLYIRIRDDSATWIYCDAVVLWPNENNNPPITGHIVEFTLPCHIIENLGVSP